MSDNRLNRIRHEFRRLLGMLLSKCSMHHIEQIRINGQDVIRKKRRLFAGWLIPPGNAFLKITGSHVIALSTIRWLEWERAIELSTDRNVVLLSLSDLSSGRNELCCRHLPGTSLRQILGDPDIPLAQKYESIRWSLATLQTLHRQVADWGAGVHQSISHGDATASNVVIDRDNQSACWIDFDIRHRPDISSLNRQTDDLFSLILTSSACLPRSCFRDLAELFVSAVPDPELLGHFHIRLADEWTTLTIFQLAQAPLRWLAAMDIRSALMQSISSRSSEYHSATTSR